jgi:carboxymethylenebutenolidase
MCDDRCHRKPVNRRSFLSGTAATLASLAGTDDARAGQKPKVARAVADPSITLEKVEFKSGADSVDAYLARPKKPGRYRAVLVVPGNWLIEPYIPETAAMLAQAGFVGLAVNLLHYFPKVNDFAEAEKVPWQTTQDLVRKEYSDERTVRNVRSSMHYVRSQPFAQGGGVGMLGFCGGGWQSLLCAARLNGVAAVVPFYAPVSLKLPGRKTPMDLVRDIKVPVQGHYGTKDKGIPLAEVRKFEHALRDQGTPVEIFTYDAGHGFFAYNRDEDYHPQAAELAWTRAVKFLKGQLNSVPD